MSLLAVTQKFTQLGPEIKKGKGLPKYDDVLNDIYPEFTSMDDPRRRIDAKIKYGTTAATVVGHVVAGLVRGTTEAWIGPVPLEFVTYFDLAESENIVKYRSIGGEFFAHQGGDNNAYRIDFLSVGPYAEVTVQALRGLRWACHGQTRGKGLTHTDESFLFDQGEDNPGLWNFEMIKAQRATVHQSTGPLSLTALAKEEKKEILLSLSPGDLKGVLQTGKLTTKQLLTFAKDKDIDPTLVKKRWEGLAHQGDVTPDEFIGVAPHSKVDPLSISKEFITDDILKGSEGAYFAHGSNYYDIQKKGYFQYHVHFPVIVKNMVFPDLWVESVQFTWDSKNGIDAVKGHVLCRRYITPPKMRWSNNGFNPSRMYGEGYRPHKDQDVKSIQLAEQKKGEKEIDKKIAADESLLQDVGWGSLLIPLQLTASITSRRKERLAVAEKWAPGDQKSSTTTADPNPYDKWLWIWEEKRDPKKMRKEIVFNLLTSAAKMTARLATTGFYTYPNVINQSMESFKEPRKIISRLML